MIDAILKQVSYITLPVKRLFQHHRLGQHPSRRRGSGFDFDQIKEYQHGESIRKVNWAATARRGGMTPLVNTYYEDKEAAVMLLVDLSASMDFGSHRLTKRAMAAEICASLSFSALTAHDRVGFMGFASEVVSYLPPRRELTYQRAIPEQILSCQAPPGAVNFSAAMAQLQQWLKYPALIFILSDFLTDHLTDLRRALLKLAQRHEIIPLITADPLELSIPTARARIRTRDLETGKTTSLNFTRQNQRVIQNTMALRQAQLRDLFQGLHLQHLTMTSHSNYSEAFSQLFSAPNRKAST